VGFVDVVPMVSQVDSAGNPTPHDVIYNLPYMRVQGGVNAVIIDPAVGDIGAALFCRRDISTVKRTRKPANPGSRRRFDWADGLYVGGFLNGVPTQYIRFSNTGVEIHTPNTLTVSAGSVVVNGPVQINGDVATTGALTNNGHAVGSTHQHLASGGTGLGGVPQ
jgi:hypothetical protein